MRLTAMTNFHNKFLLALVIATSPWLASAQQTSFEAASVRPSHFSNGCFSMLPPGGTHYAVTCVTLRNLIATAWKLNPANIQGGDEKALDAYYDITATTSDGQPWSYDTIPPMMQQLLVERFHVAVHSGTKQVSGFALIVAKGGSKLSAAKANPLNGGQRAGAGSPNFIMPGHIQMRGASLGTFASLLSSPARATVVDQTGIAGIFDVDLSFALENGNDQNLPDLFTAVEEQLGLKLKSEKITVDTLIVDHADSVPTAN